MRGISFTALKKIAKLIDGHFDAIALKFLGIIPQKRGARIFFDAEPDSLTSLFLEALDTKSPTKTEEDTLKSLLTIADGYVDALKEKTKSQILNEINGYVSNQKREKKAVNLSRVEKILETKLEGAKHHFELIAGAESNKAKNTAKALKFVKIGESLGVSDPTVCFIPTLDERNDPETLRLHVLPDRLTPRCWKLSQLGAEYHKKGDPFPKIHGTNPNCRCKLTIIPPDYGFKNGRISFISKGWDELKHQKETYGAPPTSEEFYPKKKSKQTS